jgi:hypothetical protein
MSGLDNWLMSDLQVWITLAALGGLALIFVPALGVPVHAQRRSGPKVFILVVLLAAVLGGLAWYAAPGVPAASAFAAIADRG